MYIETLSNLKDALKNLSVKIQEYDKEQRDKHSKIYGLSTDEIGDTDVEMEPESNSSVHEKSQSEESENIKNLIANNEDSKVETEYKEYKAFPKPYVIGKVINEVETDTSNQEMFRIVLSELVCQHAWNHPLGKSKTTREFFDVYKFRKADISTWKMKNVKQTVFSKNAYNEKFVDPVKDKKNEEESMQQEDEDTQLRPICEDYEGVDGDDDQTEPVQPPNNNQESDAKINEDLNDREIEEDIPELIQVYPTKASNDEPMISDVTNEKGDGVDEFDQQNYLEEDSKANYQNENEEHKVNTKGESDLTDQLYDINPVALRLSVYNFCSKKIRVEVLVKTRGEATNFHVPYCSIKAEIPANKSKAIACFPKLHPFKPFGEYFFEFITDMESNAPDIRPEAPQTDQAQGGSVTQTEDKLDPNVWPAQEDANLEGLQDEINCEVCTLFNPITNYKCDICGSTLPHRK